MALDLLVDDEHDMDAVLSWHPATWRMELEQIVGGEMPAVNLQKLSMAVLVFTTDQFFRNEDVFIKVCNVFSGSLMVPGVFDPADADECAWGITEGLLLAQPDEPEPFAEEILWYIGKVLDEEGIKTPPDVLRIAKREHRPDFSGMSVGDPGMFRVEFQMQAEEAAEIERIIRTRLVELLHELEQLPMRQGDTEDLRKRIGQGLKQVSR